MQVSEAVQGFSLHVKHMRTVCTSRNRIFPIFFLMFHPLCLPFSFFFSFFKNFIVLVDVQYYMLQVYNKVSHNF